MLRAILIAILIFFGKRSFSQTKDDDLMSCKFASYGDQINWKNWNEFLNEVSKTYAYYTASSGWQTFPDNVRFVKVLHLNEYFIKKELYKFQNGMEISDTVKSKFLTIDSLLAQKYGSSILQNDSILLSCFNKIPDAGYPVRIEFLYLLIDNRFPPILISRNGIRNNLAYYPQWLINRYYNGFYFDEDVKDEKGNKIVSQMRKKNILRGYPIKFPDKYKMFFTIDNKPTQLFLPDTCFQGVNWTEAWRYKPDYR